MISIIFTETTWQKQQIQKRILYLFYATAQERQQTRNIMSRYALKVYIQSHTSLSMATLPQPPQPVTPTGSQVSNV